MKVLIWDKGIEIKNTGGPAGYLYNTKIYLSEYPNESIVFYSDILKKKHNYNDKRSLLYNVKLKLKSLNVVSLVADIYWFYFQKAKLTQEEKALLDIFDYVHIHTVSQYLRSFLDYKRNAKIILTTHMPEPCIDEIADRSGFKFMFLRIPILRNYFIRKELQAFEGCNRVMFPVKDAKEVYTNNSNLYREMFDNIENKFFYVPTCILDDISTSYKNHILKEANIPDEALKVCFIGRHNEIKGYDSLKEMASTIWGKNPNTYFLIGGKEHPLKGLSDKRWIELGWVNTPELLNEIDVFILPNKETYFDLILLEVIRQGVPCIISKTGGNKFFERQLPEGIILYDYNNSQSMSKIISFFMEKKSKNELQIIKKQIKEYFTHNFTMNYYIKNYLSEINSFS